MVLPILLAEGTFSHEAGQFTLESNGELKRINPILEALAGYGEILAVISHLPSKPPQMDAWGLGCCRWVNTGYCPFGHHVNPHSLYFREIKGKLSLGAEGGWLIDGELLFDLRVLPGHVCRVILCPSRWDNITSEAFDGSGEVAADLARLLGILRSGSVG